jgi:hypothetical protein
MRKQEICHVWKQRRGCEVAKRLTVGGAEVARCASELSRALHTRKKAAQESVSERARLHRVVEPASRSGGEKGELD